MFYRFFNVDELFLVDFRYFFNKYLGMGLINLVVIGEEFNFFYINWNFGCFIVFDFEIVEFCNVLGDFFFF